MDEKTYPELTIREAAEQLYMAGKWSLLEYKDSRSTDSEEQAGMWAALRDALDLPEGTATEAGVGR